ncbi:hypothetical protein SLEP1_g22774 [Rubroshorea leprosula]|uniref:Uncharacterized protein n=1 Tax=Rubroshorea leprosula TaxID=152421 RepID=A0AAV5JGC2_9ROSI|nr:hypothetical protein SLEP1_g22774 [Rubroshorea leprosula]
MIFPSFLVLEPDLEPRNLPLQEASGSALSFLPCPPAALACGVLRDSSLHLPPASLPNCSSVLLAKLWFLIVLSV